MSIQRSVDYPIYKLSILRFFKKKKKNYIYFIFLNFKFNSLLYYILLTIQINDFYHIIHSCHTIGILVLL